MTEDEMRIKELIERQFTSLSWVDGSGGDWAAFAADFVLGASLYPAARPLVPKTVNSFTNRLESLSKSELTQFHEHLIGFQIQVYGNVAVAIALCEMIENRQEVKRNVETLLLVKDEGGWCIAAQAWDGVKVDRSDQLDKLQLVTVT